MDHIAIMNRSLHLLPKILEGSKSIESRWYMTRRSPWGKVKKGDTIYFKNSSERVTVMTKVEKVIQYSNLSQKKVKTILQEHYVHLGITKSEIGLYYNLHKNKKYCVLVFLSDVREVKPFDINKKGFGSQSAWITTTDINNIRAN